MKSFHQMLRDKGYLRPAREHEQPEGWQQERTDVSWKSGKNPAIKTKRSQAIAKPPEPAKAPVKQSNGTRKSDPKLQCKTDGCVQDANKSGYCPECLKIIKLEKKRIYRAKKRAEFKESQTCRICGDPRLPNQSLCRIHYNEYWRKHNNAGADTLKEINMASKKARLEAIWQQIQQEYENGKR